MQTSALRLNDAVEDEIDDRSVLVFPGGTGVPPVLSGRDGRTGVPPCRDGDGPKSLNPRVGGFVPGVTGAAKLRGNGRPARFPTNNTGGTPVPPAQTRDCEVHHNLSYWGGKRPCPLRQAPTRSPNGDAVRPTRLLLRQPVHRRCYCMVPAKAGSRVSPEWFRRSSTAVPCGLRQGVGQLPTPPWPPTAAPWP
jgi:hypothetical protein